jgi:hypothetical protein
MLSLRSKLAVTLVVAIGIGVLFEYFANLNSWAEPRAHDWYVGWIIFGILAAVALVSIIIDVRKDRAL